ncbi:hypothetical protein Tco_0689407 [Tanacetum coccineum]
MGMKKARIVFAFHPARQQQNSDSQEKKEETEEKYKNDDDGDSNADDSERTNSDSNEEVNPNLNLKDDEEEETQEDEYDVNITPKDTEPKKEGKGDAGITNDGLKDISQEKTYKQVIDDEHVTLTSTQKSDGSKQSSSVSSDFASKFLNLDKVPPADNEVASLMNVKTHQEDSSTQAPPLLIIPVTAIPETSFVTSTTVPPTIHLITPIPQQTTPTPTPTTEPTTSLIPTLSDFSSLFGFDQRVLVLEMEISQFKQVDHSAQLLATIK